MPASKNKTASPHSSKEILSWQYKTLLGELQAIELHETGDCPCILSDLNPRERCLGKHLINVSVLCTETANGMDINNAKWLLELAAEANERIEQFKEFVCHTGDLPPLADWARKWRKEHVEDVYYSCKVKMRQEMTCTLEQDRISYIDHSVRDLPQQAVLWTGEFNPYIKINSKVGARINYMYQFPVADYKAMIKRAVNPNYDKREFIEAQLKRVIKPADWDSFIEYPQNSRVIDSQIRATDKVLEMSGDAVKPAVKVPATCTITKTHDDGDLSLACKTGNYLLTTEGKKFKETQARLLQANLERMVIPKEQMGFDLGALTCKGPVCNIAVKPKSAYGPNIGPPKFQPFQFQAEGIAWLKGRKFALLADDMGLGKTNQAIYWAANDNLFPCLVVVPAALPYNWQREIAETWLPGDTTLVLDGEVRLPSQLPRWTIVSYGGLPKYMSDLRKAGFKAVIVDEAHLVKNLEAQRTKNLLDLVDPLKPQPGDKPIPNRLAVTGTPLLNRPIELFSLLVFLGVYPRNYYSWFLNEYTENESYMGRTIFKGSKNLDKLNKFLLGFMIRRMKKDVLKQLPPKTNTPLFVPITNKAEYLEAEKNFLSWLRDKEGDEVAARAAKAEILTRMNHLRQLAAMGKVGAVCDWLKPCYDGQGKVIIFSTFPKALQNIKKCKNDLGAIIYDGSLSGKKKKGEATSPRQQLVDDFQKNGNCYFYGTIGAAGVGITLTAANREVFLDLPWTPGAKSQAEDRAYRIGQTRPVEVVNVLARGTIDERMLGILAEKEKVIAQAIDGQEKDEAENTSIAQNLMDSFLANPSFNQRVEQYQPEVQDPDVDQVEIAEGFRQTYKEHTPESLILHDNLGIIPPEYDAFKVQLELKRSEKWNIDDAPLLNEPGKVQQLFTLMRKADREWVMVICCDTRLRLIGLFEMAIGNADTAIVSPQEIARIAIHTGATNVFVAHNHPSGDPSPSDSDRSLRLKLQDTLKALDIEMPDFYVVGHKSDWSFTTDYPITVPPFKPLQPARKIPVPKLPSKPGQVRLIQEDKRVLNKTFRLRNKVLNQWIDINADSVEEAIRKLGWNDQDVDIRKVWKSSGKPGTSGEISAGWGIIKPEGIKPPKIEPGQTVSISGRCGASASDCAFTVKRKGKSKTVTKEVKETEVKTCKVGDVAGLLPAAENLLSKGSCTLHQVTGYQTAISRKTPPEPLKWLHDHNHLQGRMLDYGSGRHCWFDMECYDPHWQPKRPTGRFDTITCIYVLNVVTEAEQTKIFNDIKSLLNPEGAVFIVVRRDLPTEGKPGKGTYQRFVKLGFGLLNENASRAIYGATVGYKGELHQVPCTLHQEPTVKVTGQCSTTGCKLAVKGSIEKKTMTDAPGLSDAINASIHHFDTRKAAAVTSKTFAPGITTATRYDFDFKIVEAHDLIVSHDPFSFAENPKFKAKLQPRIRDRAAYKLQVQGYARNLSPEKLLLDTHSIDTSTPIVDKSNLVLCGNGRVMAILIAEKEFPANIELYRNALKRVALDLGLPVKPIDSMKVPVLVRVLLTPTDLQAFAEECNAPPAMQASMIEKARTDSDKITPAMIQKLDVLEDETIEDALKSRRNNAFVSDYLNLIPPNERTTMQDAAGMISSDGIRRMAAGVFIATFKGPVGVKIAAQFLESVSDSNVKNAFNGILRSLAIIAQAENLINAGARSPGLTFTEDLAKTVQIYSELRKNKASIPDYINQSAFDRYLTPFQERVLMTLDEYSRSAKRIGNILSYYAQAVIESPPPGQSTMMPTEPPSKERLFAQAVKKVQGEVEAERIEREAKKVRQPEAVLMQCNLEASPSPEKFRAMADAMQKQIDEKRDPGVSHQNVTARRSRIASGMAADADYLEETQKAMLGMADAMEAGTLPDILSRVSSRTQVEQILHHHYKLPEFHKGYIRDLKEIVDKAQMSPEKRIGFLDLLDIFKNRTDNMDTYQVELRNDDEIKMVETLVYLGKQGSNAGSLSRLSEDINEGKRLIAMGINDKEAFNRAKAALKAYISGPSPEVLAKKRQRELEAKIIGVKIPGFFPTPRKLAEEMVYRAMIEPGMSILEPSAGIGSIADVIKESCVLCNLTLVELSYSLIDILKAKGYNPVQMDFMEYTGSNYDRILMNPPFEHGQDVDHVRHAYDLLKPGGRLIAIMGEHCFFGSEKKCSDFRDWLDSVGESEKLPEGSFKGSEAFVQTGVNARIVTIDKAKVTNEKPVSVERETDTETIPINPHTIDIGDKIQDRDYGLITVTNVYPYNPKYPKSQMIDTEKGRRDVGGRDIIYVTRKIILPPVKYDMGDTVEYFGETWQVGFVNKNGTYRLQKGPSAYDKQVNNVYPEGLKLIKKNTTIKPPVYTLPEREAAHSGKPVQGRLFSYDMIKRLLAKCNLTDAELDTALNYRPLRNLLATAIGWKDVRVQLCSAGLVPGVYQVTIDGLTENNDEKIMALVKKSKEIKQVYTRVAGQRVFETVVPEQSKASDVLAWKPQEVSHITRLEPAEQAKMFKGKCPACALMLQDKKAELRFDPLLSAISCQIGVGCMASGKPSGKYRITESGRNVEKPFDIVDETGHYVEGPFRYFNSAKKAMDKLEASELPVCSVEQKKDREKIVKAIKATLPAGCTSKEWKKPLSERQEGCVNPHAIATVQAGCRLGRKGEAK